MSRLIVKGLPKNITEEKLRNLFESKGTITDIQLKYTKEGVFRQFAFVGYQSDDQAEAALEHFNNAYIQTSRVKVEICAPLGSVEKPKAWSKYSKESTAYKKEHGIEEEQFEEYKKEPDGKNKKRERLDKILGSHKDDPKFKEFLEVHAKNRNLWDNDATLLNDSTEDNDASKEERTIVKDSNKNEKKKTRTKKHEIKQPTDDEIEAATEETANNEDDENDEKLAEKKISDIDYMKSLIKKSSDNDTASTKKSKKDLELFTIKLHNIPYKVKRQDILNFFKPFKPFSVRLPTKIRGFCYVGFKTEKEFEKAQIRNKSFIKGKQIFFSDFTEKNKITKHKLSQNTESQIDEGKKQLKWQRQEDALRNEESIAESGRIFFRNLSYTVNEDDIQQVFEKYGPVAEVNLPIDSTTRKIKGFGTVTFVLPEHAVRAFSELDGTLFHGRLFHLIPAISKELSEGHDSEAGLNFREKKELQLKKAAGQSHNWNTLFLGANAVADLLAKRFDASKETVLDSKTGGSSAAVRLALGETQIVMEMKQFLEENDVQLSIFDEIDCKRSKTVILAKNLPGETTVSELRPIFSKFGLIGRIVFPPSGVTALIEFLDPSEAKNAFNKLAYSKFKSLPLYLEWAPENTFKSKLTDVAIKQAESDNKKEKKKKNQNKTELAEVIEEQVTEELQPDEEDDDCDDDPDPETTLFLRNLNFKTREDAIRAHFKHLGAIHMVQVAMRKDPDDPKTKVSLGYGFIQFKRKGTSEKALKTMQFTQIEGNQVELKRSDRTLKSDVKKDSKKPLKTSKQTGSKILVRNIPFQAKVNEVRDIFKAFGELKSVRLPKKMTPGEDSHRGFGFVDFVSKSEAKKAFNALSQSTHLYGRRLVLEWAAVDDNSVDELRKRTADSYGYDKSSKFSRKSIFDANVVNSAETNDDYA